MNRPKRHHYIPEMLSKQFADRKGKLYFYDKRMPPEQGVQRSVPKNVFVEKDLYTFDLDGDKDVYTEEFLAKLEGKASPIIKKIVDNSRMGRLPNLTPNEKDVCVLFLFTLIKRSPDTREQYMYRLRASELLRYWYREIYGTERIDPERMEDLIRKVWPLSLREFDELMEREVLPTLRRMRIGIAVIQEGQTGFVIGSNPSVRIGFSADLRDPSIQLWMAVAHDVIVIFSHDDEAEILGDLSSKDVQLFNREIAKTSKVIAGNSRELIATLAA